MAPSSAAAPAPDRGFGAVDGILPPDMLLEVLLRLSAKPICRLRSVCRSWLAFTSDPHFVAARAHRHPGPLLAVGVQTFPRIRVDLIDLSGNVVKQILCKGKGRVVSGSFDHVFLEYEGIRILDPTTGSISTLPHHCSNGIEHWLRAWFAFGQVASTGEHKFDRIVLTSEYRHLSEVITISETNRQWRKMENPPDYLDLCNNNGVIFIGSFYFNLNIYRCAPSLRETCCIPSFDLATEQWSMTLHGPVKRILEDANGTLSYHSLIGHLMLAVLKDTLSTTHWNYISYVVEIWFLTDFEKGIWSKEYRIKIFNGIGYVVKMQTLLVTDEGKIILWLRTGSHGVVQIYNPVTNTSSDSIYTGAGVHTGSLLCPGSV